VITALPNPFSSSRGSTEGRAVSSNVVETARDVPRHASGSSWSYRAAGVESCPRETTDRSTAVRIFGLGDVLAKLETELAGFVAELNARDRLMRRRRLDYDDPPPLFLAAWRDDRGHGHGQMPRSGKRPTPLQVLRALSERVLRPTREGLRP
jgi:hypothetical protein